MIQTAIINRLRADTALAAILSTTAGQPSVFDEHAPEQSAMPHLVVRVDVSQSSTLVHEFTIFVDFYDRNKSRANSKLAAQRIELVLDQQVVQHDQYSDIRINFFSGSPMTPNDSRDIIYNTQFFARGIRKSWIIQH